ncbi:MAG: bifunctional folylpolyglutamate synthase/dihydrofolate synthase [Fimbriimonadaceae bacterium]|nr:bifunctional folylpolyglutamate synthase/dihydrofolate synthase [Fimbriimonadaceae bacterium]
MTYEEAVAYLTSLAPRGWRLGLDRMREFARRAGLEDTLGGMSSPRLLHVAGTNGKGSVTAYLQSVLHEAGFLAGGYYSPFVYDVRERIQLGRRLISEEEFASLVAALAPIAASFDGTEFGEVSEFEFKTAMGLRFWKERACDWVALEVGLGGRLDATNIVTPAAGAIVSIGYDHTGILGDTLPQIAAEKAGIAKPGVPLVVGAVSDEAFAPIERIANDVGAPVWRLGREFRFAGVDGKAMVETPVGVVDGLVPGIVGVVQSHNAAVAVATLHAAGLAPDEETIRRGIGLARMPGRFEQRRVDRTRVILDGAHNGESARALAETFRSAFMGYPPRSVVLLAGMVQGHDPATVLGPLGELADRVHLTPIDFRRTYDVASLSRAFTGSSLPVALHPDAKTALAAALQDAGEEGVVLVAGSFYLVGEVGRLLDER